MVVVEMADEASRWVVGGLLFLVGLLIGVAARESRRNYLTEFTRDASGRIVQIVEYRIR